MLQVSDVSDFGCRVRVSGFEFGFKVRVRGSGKGCSDEFTSDELSSEKCQGVVSVRMNSIG